MALTDKLTAIGDAIREKNGTTEPVPLKDMPQAILDIVSGGGVQYESIIYNEDNTITLTDKDGNEHTMGCEYSEEGKLVGISYDGEELELAYDGDTLVRVGGAMVDLANAQTSAFEPLDHTVKFIVEGEPYEVVSVKDGNLVNAPSGTPTSTEGSFESWRSKGENISFPIKPTEDMIINALFMVVRSEMACSTAQTFLNTVYGTKTNDGLCVCAYFGSGNISEWHYCFVVGKTEEAIETSKRYDKTGTLEYNGETWHYGYHSHSSLWDGFDFSKLEDGAVVPAYLGKDSSDRTKILDHYYIVT